MTTGWLIANAPFTEARAQHLTRARVSLAEVSGSAEKRHLFYTRETRGLRDENRDVASASLLENWLDEPRGEHGFSFEARGAS
jgi:hypothetical protein